MSKSLIRLIFSNSFLNAHKSSKPASRQLHQLTSVLKLNKIDIKSKFRSFKTNHQYSQESSSRSQSSRARILLSSGLFTLGFGTICFTGSVVFSYELANQKQSHLSTRKFSRIRSDLNNFWNQLSPVKKCTMGIIFLNTLVFIAWRLPNFQPILIRNFQLEGFSSSKLQLLLSTFSHRTIAHLALNMLCLYSMSNTLSSVLSPSQFVAFYLSSGVFASFISRTAKLATLSAIPSIGASGAVISCFALATILFPTHQYYVFPIPYPIEGSLLLKVLVAFDLAGLLIFRRIGLDHAAHLGGVIYGCLFYKYAPSIISDYQRFVLREWKAFRSKSQ